MHIHHKVARQNTHVLESQARLFALLVEQLIRVRGALALNEFQVVPEYEMLLHAGDACCFVCTDFKPMDGDRFSQTNLRPNEYLSDCSFRFLRHWVHHLFRAERWADGYSSPILEAIDSGALQLVAARIKDDRRLREPETLVLEDFYSEMT